MVYIIENANILKGNQLTKRSLLIKDNRIAALDSSFNRSLHMKMNAQGFIMTPAHVLFNLQVQLIASFQTLKKYMLENFLLNGCTTIFTYADVNFENEITKKVNELRTNLLSSPIDFLIGIRIPLRLLTPSFIRKCKKEKVPGIIVEISNLKELEMIPWGWIKEALFPYNCPLIPILSESIKSQAKYALAVWKKIMEKEKITAAFEELEENMPLSAEMLNKIGVFPEKSCLVHGAELSYNLYLKSSEIKNLDEKQLFLYHSDILVVTVHKGKVIRAGNEVLFKPGYGEYVKVKIPSYFSKDDKVKT
jgi:hypothetical protein